MQKTRYELDPYNRLVINASGDESDLPEFRQVLDGRFRTDENNELSYHVKAPLPEDANIPNQVRLKGIWSLSDDHDLTITLDKSARETFGDKITLQGEILDADKNTLLFAVTTVTKENKGSIYVLQLSGSWKTDENNRLTFHVIKKDGASDILTMSGAWDIGDNNQLVYQYKKSDLITKETQTHTLIFKGNWDINDKACLSYVLSGDTDSVFAFKTGVGIFKEDYIRYEAEIGLVSRADPVERVITLSGRWYLKKDVGLVFAVQYGNERTGAIVFGADAKLTDNDTVSFALKNYAENRDMGVELELSHDILEGDGQLFLRVLASKREQAIYAGAAWRW
ncbi:MAG: hypothetical protein HQL28_04390 [Candidatus Omnitrophica bacterium]|nr:hypothetical protein [Candidatus Omnitrophota bacterium]